MHSRLAFSLKYTICLKEPKFLFTTPPTPDNNTATLNKSQEVNVTITESNLNEFKWNWNGTSYTIMNDSLVLMYNLDNRSSLGENSTFVKDLSGNNNNGTFIFNNGTSAWTSGGKYDGAWSFDGDGDYITIPYSDSLNASNITVSFWLKPNNPVSYGAVVV